MHPRCASKSRSHCMKNHYTLRFRADLDLLMGADMEVERWLDQSSAPRSSVHWVRLVLEELGTHTIKYGRGEVDTVAIEVTVRRETWGTAIEYRDNGLACDPFSVPSYDLDLPVEQRPIQGLGIHLIRKMSDHIAYGWKDGWNCLRLEKLTRGVKECPKLSVE